MKKDYDETYIGIRNADGSFTTQKIDDDQIDAVLEIKAKLETHSYIPDDQRGKYEGGLTDVIADVCRTLLEDGNRISSKEDAIFCVSKKEDETAIAFTCGATWNVIEAVSEIIQAPDVRRIVECALLALELFEAGYDPTDDILKTLKIAGAMKAADPAPMREILEELKAERRA